MRALIQRVRRGRVTVAGETVGQIGVGYVILLGVTHGDTEATAAALARRTATLRLFPDDDGRMSHSLVEIGGEALVISQFTLYGDLDRGTRPSWSAAAPAAVAEPIYEAYLAHLSQRLGRPVASGRFGSEMEVELVNTGPVTLMIESTPLR